MLNVYLRPLDAEVGDESRPVLNAPGTVMQSTIETAIKEREQSAKTGKPAKLKSLPIERREGLPLKLRLERAFGRRTSSRSSSSRSAFLALDDSTPSDKECPSFIAASLDHSGAGKRVNLDHQ